MTLTEQPLSFIVVDQVGSTEQIQRLGDRRAADIRAVLLDLMGGAVAEWGGSIYHYTGDGLMASFEDAVAATWAAVSMARSASDWSRSQPPGEGIELRAGIHSGLPVITADGHFIGIDCHIAARLCSVAEPGTIVVSDRTLPLLDDAIMVESIGHRTLKGISEPPELFSVVWSERPLPTPPFPGAAAPAPAPVGGRSASDVAVVPPSPLLLRSTVRAGTFVGRDREIAALGVSWARAVEGDRSVVLLAGPAGFGKSSLAAGFAATGLVDTGTLLAGRCDEFATSSYEPFIEALQHLVHHLPIGILAEHASIYGEVLSVLVPELGPRLGVEFVDAELDDSSVDRLFAAVVDLLARASRTRPVFLLIEDLHWASEATLRLLRHVVRDASLSHVMIVATLRADGLRRDTEPIVLDMQRESGVERLEMRPFSVDDVIELIPSMVDGIRGPRLVDLATRIVDDTGATPFFVREVIRHLREVYPDGALPDLGRGEPLPLPDTVIDVVHRRVDHLGSGARSVLELAAIIGAEFDLRVLAAVSDQSEDEIADIVDAAEVAQLIVPGTASLDETYRFAHDLFRAALSAPIGTARRRRIHSRIADAIVEFVGLNVSTAANALRHLVAAGRPHTLGLALQAADLAAEAATARFAYPDAVTHQETALEISRQWAEADDELHAAREIALGDALNRAGRVTDAREHFWIGAQLARASERRDLLYSAALGYGGELPTTPPQDPRADELLTEVLADPDLSAAHRARAASRLAEWRHTTAPLAERLLLCDEAVTLARSIDDPHVLGRVLVSRARALHGPAAATDNLDIGTEIRVIGEATASDDLRFHAASIISTAALELGDLERTARETAAAADLGKVLRHFAYTRSSLMWDAMLANAAGDWEVADRNVARLTELLQANQHLQSGLIQGAIVLPRLWLQGESELLHRMVSAVNDRDFTGMAAGYAAEAGLLDDARRHLDDFGAVQRVEELNNYNFWHLCFALSTAAAALADRELAAALHAIMTPYADHNALMGTVAFLGSAQHHLGVVALASGDLDEADLRFGHAIERHDALGFAPWTALSTIERARVLELLGGSSRADEARALADDAIATASRLGLGAVTRRAELLVSRPTR
jgi:class 3 adenylate cyclase